MLSLPLTPKHTQQNTKITEMSDNTEIYAKMNDDNAAGCAAALLIMMLFGLGLLIWVAIEATGFRL